MFPIEIAIDRGFLSPNFFRSTLVGLPRQPKGVTGLLQIHRLSRRSWPGTAVEFCGSSEANDIFVFKQIASIPNFRTQLSASVLKIFFWFCPQLLLVLLILSVDAKNIPSPRSSTALSSSTQAGPCCSSPGLDQHRGLTFT